MIYKKTVKDSGPTYSKIKREKFAYLSKAFIIGILAFYLLFKHY